MAQRLAGGLGTPWNTLQLGGAVRLASAGPDGGIGAGPLARGTAAPTSNCSSVSSRLSTLDTLGSYRLTVAATRPAMARRSSRCRTQQGALQLIGQRQHGPGRRALSRRGPRGRRRRGGADQPAEHHRAARRRAVRHFDRMSMKPLARLRGPRARRVWPAALAGHAAVRLRSCRAPAGARRSRPTRALHAASR